MKILKISPLFLILVCCFSLYGQNSREIAADEFLKVRSDAYQKINEYNRRTRGKIETFASTGGKLEESTVFIEERILPDKRRMLVTETKGGVAKTTEIIRISSIEYKKIDNGAWTSRDLSGIGGGTGSGTGTGSSESKFKYTLTETTLNNKEVTLYEQYITVPENEDVRFAHEKMWIDKAGRLIKRDFRGGFEKSGNVVRHNVVDYEYDPKDLKIEAPVMSEKKLNDPK